MKKNNGLKVLLLLGMFIAAPAVSFATSISDFINRSNCDQVLDKGLFQICYDYKAKGARFVGYTLFGDKVNAVNIKKRPRFYPDKHIPARYRTKYSDYTHNIFRADRGHLMSDASADNSPASLRKVYVLSQIIPQYSKINRKTWIKAEKYERKVAVKLGSVMVINGVDYGNYSQRLRSGIAYPVAFWKMIYDNNGFERCFYYRNTSKAKIKGDKLRDHLVDCRELKTR